MVVRAERVFKHLLSPLSLRGRQTADIMNLAATFVNDLGCQVRHDGSCYIRAAMDESELSRYMSEMGRKGAKARARNLTPAERKAIAQKAGKASGKARRRKAKRRKG